MVARESQRDCRGQAEILDAILVKANRLNLLGWHYRPYWLMSDVAGLAAFSYAEVFSLRFPTVSGMGLILAILVALLVYKLVLELKAAMGKPAARSFLQDCLLIIIPSFLLVSYLLKQPMGLSLAFLGTLMPLYGCLARMGCFLGGCCYGKASKAGVLYPASIFQSNDHGCRRYSPSPDPGTRVFPVQLVEAAAQAVLFVTLAAVLWQAPDIAASIFWIYLYLYAVVRFVLDFFRTTSARPRYWRFSEAQLVCLGIQVVGMAVLVQQSFRVV